MGPTPKRGKNLLRIIGEHGPINIDLLQRIVEPPATKKNLRKSLAALQQKDLIEKIQDGHHLTYYILSQSSPSRDRAADKLNCHPGDNKKPLLRRQDWFHNQWCEYWIVSMKRQFPDAEIIREHSIGGHEFAMNVLQIRPTDLDVRPDFLLILPGNGISKAAFVAFEIERTRKSDGRIMRKFKKYMDGTFLDGLIYICDSGRLSETIRLLYQSKLLAQSERIKRYGEHFFLFSDRLDGGGSQLPRLLNSAGRPVRLADWCGYLRSTQWTKRRDEQFENLGVVPDSRL